MMPVCTAGLIHQGTTLLLTTATGCIRQRLAEYSMASGHLFFGMLKRYWLSAGWPQSRESRSWRHRILWAGVVTGPRRDGRRS